MFFLEDSFDQLLNKAFVQIWPYICDMDRAKVLLFALGGFPNSSNLKSWINCQ